MMELIIGALNKREVNYIQKAFRTIDIIYIDENISKIEVTKNPPRVSGDGKSGFFVKNKDHIVIVDDLSADWLRIKAAAEHTTPEAIIGRLIRKEISQTA